MGTEREFDGVRAASATSIEIDFYYAQTRCKERIKLQPTPANLKRAFLHRAAILAEIERGTFDYATVFPNSKKAKLFAKVPEAINLTLGMYLDQWVEARKKRHKDSTNHEYEKTARLLHTLLGQLELVKVNRGDIKTALKDRNCGNARLRTIQSVLRNVMNDALDEGLITDNPLEGWRYSNVERVKEDDDIDPFSKEEQVLLLNHCEGQFKNLLQFAMWTGLRTSEMIALDWRDIDWVRKVVRVNKAMTTHSKQAEATKTRAGKREVKLLQPALLALEAQKEHTHKKGKEVFQDPRYGERWLGDQPIREGFWKPTIKKSGVRYRRPYQTRHTYASMMLSAGENPMWVAQQIGHSDWGIVRRIYGRFLADAAPDAGGKAEALYGANVDRNVDHTNPKQP